MQVKHWSHVCFLSCVYSYLFPGLEERCHWLLWVWIVQRSSTRSRGLHKPYTIWLWHQQYSGLVTAASHGLTAGADYPRKGNKLGPVTREWGCRRSATCMLLGFFRARYLWPLVGFSDADHVSEAVFLVDMVPGDIVKVLCVFHLNFKRRLRFHCTSARSYDLISSVEMTNTEILSTVSSAAYLTHIRQGPAGWLTGLYWFSVWISRLCVTHGADG